MTEDPHFVEAGILSGAEISDQVANGRIRIEPDFNDRFLNPASYDLTLGSKVAVYKEAVRFVVGGKAYELEPLDGTYRANDGGVLDMKRGLSDWMYPNPTCILSSKRKHEVATFDMHTDGWLLKPGIGYLMHTAERICTEEFVPVLDGKSSLGRLFMTAHVTAGYGDPGFDGQYTLEVVVTQPVVVYPGMRFCQIRFHTLVGRRRDYKKNGGHYVGELAAGPVPSMSWKQFEEQG